VRRFIDETLAARARDGRGGAPCIRTRRLVPELTSKNGQIRAAAERVTVNMPIRGRLPTFSAPMIDVHAALDARPASRQVSPARMILTVHDELLFEVPRDEPTRWRARPRAHGGSGSALGAARGGRRMAKKLESGQDLSVRSASRAPARLKRSTRPAAPPTAIDLGRDAPCAPALARRLGDKAIEVRPQRRPALTGQRA